MPTTARTPDTTRLLSLTHEAFAKTVQPNVYEGSKLLNILKQRGAMVQTSGDHYSFVVQSAESANSQWYSSSTIALRNAENLTTKLHADPKFVRVPFTLPDTDLDLNAGNETKIQDIYRQYAAIAREQLAEEINSRLFTDNSATSEEIDGLETIIEDSNTYLGLVRSVDTFWKANENDAASDFSANGFSKMEDMWLLVQHSTRKKTDLIITTQAGWRNYAEVIHGKLQVQSREMEDLGYDYLMFNGTPIIWDRDCTANRMYFLALSGGVTAAYKCLYWKDMIMPLRMEEYIEGITTGFKAVLNPISSEPRALGKILNVDTL